MAEHLDPFDAEAAQSRRELLRMSGRGGMGLAAMSLLAACSAGTSSGLRRGSASPSELPPLAKQLSVAQWPLYIDREKGGTHPSLEKFMDATGIQVDYQTVINDNQAFFAQLVPQLAVRAGDGLGHHLAVGLGRDAHGRSRTGSSPLDWSLLPTASANMLPAFKDPAYDPGNGYSVPWQGGLTGIAYYPDKVGGTITSFDQLFDEKLANHVGHADRDGRHVRPHVAVDGHRPAERHRGRRERGRRQAAAAARLRRAAQVLRAGLHRRPHARRPVGLDGVVGRHLLLQVPGRGARPRVRRARHRRPDLGDVQRDPRRRPSTRATRMRTWTGTTTRRWRRS